jgi:polar amino acid transport system permease protein
MKFWDGLIATIWISAISLILSTVIGLVVAACREYGNILLQAMARVYVELIRGTPLLVQILVFFYVIANVAGLENRYAAGILSLSIFSGAYMSEIIRSGISAVGKTQLDSAKAIGLTQTQTLRYVVLPQAARVALPPAAGQLISLIKDSSLLSVIAISELTLNAQEINSFTYSTLESYLPLALLYLTLTLPLALLIRVLERRLRFET